MKTLNQILIITAALLVTNISIADDGSFQNKESQALRKVIAANEVASLNAFGGTTVGITYDLVDVALRVLRNNNGGQTGGITLGTYVTPKWFSNHDADADFNVPSGQQLKKFTFETSGRVYADYVLIFNRKGREIYREDIGQQINGSLEIQVPQNIKLNRISVLRLHNVARRGTRITAIGSKGGNGGGGKNKRAKKILRRLKNLLMNHNPDMQRVSARLTRVERLLSE